MSIAGVKDTDTARSIMKRLDLACWVKASKCTSTGTPTRYAINPKVHTKFAEQAEKEKRDRAEGQRKIKEAVEAFAREKTNGDI